MDKSARKVRNAIIQDLLSHHLTPWSHVEVNWLINRTPCYGCATTRVSELLQYLKEHPLISKMDLRLVIEATTISSEDIGGTAGLERLLMQPNVEIRASTIWAEMEKLLAPSEQYYDKGSNMYFTKGQFDQFKQHAANLQEEIDFIVKTKGLEPKPITKGSG